MTVEDKAIAWSYYVGAQEFTTMPLVSLKGLRPHPGETFATYRGRVIQSFRAGSTGDKG